MINSTPRAPTPEQPRVSKLEEFLATVPEPKEEHLLNELKSLVEDIPEGATYGDLFRKKLRNKIKHVEFTPAHRLAVCVLVARRGTANPPELTSREDLAKLIGHGIIADNLFPLTESIPEPVKKFLSIDPIKAKGGKAPREKKKKVI